MTSMNDLISRDAAIDVMCELMRHWFGGDPKDEIREIKRELEKLPSAEPEPKKGRWIRLYYNRPRQYTRICSECGEICWFCGIGDYNYCPWCGARMDVPDNDVGETEGEEG